MRVLLRPERRRACCLSRRLWSPSDVVETRGPGVVKERDREKIGSRIWNHGGKRTLGERATAGSHQLVRAPVPLGRDRGDSAPAVACFAYGLLLPDVTRRRARRSLKAGCSDSARRTAVSAGGGVCCLGPGLTGRIVTFVTGLRTGNLVHRARNRSASAAANSR
jgi:hypothetical protein